VPPEVHAADRLLNAIERRRSPVCVGIDPVIDKLPRSLRAAAPGAAAAAAAVSGFSEAVIAAVAPHVPCIKLQAACFERYRSHGLNRLFALIGAARARELEVILDWKRGDIGISAEHYAAAAFDAGWTNGADARPDWVTVSSYLGEDGITPFLRDGFGAFALVRTSNPGGDVIQRQRLTDGRTVAEVIAQLVARCGQGSVGRRGYSALGAVVGATKADEAAALRRLMPRQIILVPGYGAQGGTAADIRACFNDDGTGALVTASRSVIYAFDPDDADWSAAVGAAARSFADEIGRAVGLR
jgi:orotidine-5'-phosphate decarboxylase